MVYLIGVNHFVQFATDHRAKIVRDTTASFKAHVLEVIEPSGISIVAEEFNDEAKRIWRVSGDTVLQHVAKAKGIEHRFCEPGREEMWLDQIADCKSKNVVFVCGDDHFDSFAVTLENVGFDLKRGPRYRISDAELFADL
jgi:hypothetical protein